MTPEQLKNSILQLAIEGKLVPQDKSEGTGAELLKTLQSASLTAPLVRGAKKALPPVTSEEEPFAIPDNWCWSYINDIADVTKLAGFEYSSVICSNLSATGIPLFKGKNVQNGKLIYEFEAYIPKTISDSLPRSQLNRKCLLTPYVGTIGNIAIFDGLIRAHLGSNVGKIEIKTNGTFKAVTEEFLMYYLRSYSGFLELTKMKKATAQESISIDAIRKVIVPLPPLAEQKRIVAKLEELLPLVEEYAEYYDQLQKLNQEFPGKLKKALLQFAIEGKLVPQDKSEGTGAELLKTLQSASLTAPLVRGAKKALPPVTPEEEPFVIPDNWCWCRLGEIVRLVNGDRGKNYPSKDKLRHIGDIPFISAINITDNTVYKDGLLYLSREQYDKLGSGKLQKNDVVVCIRGSLGKCCIYPYEKGAIASSLVILRQSLYVSAEFLLTYINCNLFVQEVRKYDNGTAQPNLAANNLANFLFPLPPLAEQKRIVAKLEELLPLCESLESR